MLTDFGFFAVISSGAYSCFLISSSGVMPDFRIVGFIELWMKSTPGNAFFSSEKTRPRSQYMNSWMQLVNMTTHGGDDGSFVSMSFTPPMMISSMLFADRFSSFIVIIENLSSPPNSAAESTTDRKSTRLNSSHQI